MLLGALLGAVLPSSCDGKMITQVGGNDYNKEIVEQQSEGDRRCPKARISGLLA
jgi:hypothetical protein